MTSTSIRRTTIFLVLGLAVLGAAWYYITPKFYPKAPATAIATVVKPHKALTAFNVIDTNGNKFTEKSLHGHWTLLFFGYMGCPDICPHTLGILRDAWNLYPQQQAPARFVFASIDPAPVANNSLKTFLQNYNPEFIGLTGPAGSMDQLSDQLGIYYKQDQGVIDHTATMMLIDPQGRLYAVFTPPFTAQEVAKDLDLLTHN